jgi:hypothetical protein
MNKKLVFSVMLVCLFVFIAVLAFAQNSPSVRWEYTLFRNHDDTGYVSDATIEKANQLGTQGWELATTAGYNSIQLIFKRRLP